MDALLNDYYTNVVDKAYHRLLTSDNVSKFRPEIVERLESNSRSARFLNKASGELAELKEISEEEAREEVLSMLHEVIDAFRQMDEILGEINKRIRGISGLLLTGRVFYCPPGRMCAAS